MKLNNHHST